MYAWVLQLKENQAPQTHTSRSQLVAVPNTRHLGCRSQMTLRVARLSTSLALDSACVSLSKTYSAGQATTALLTLYGGLGALAQLLAPSICALSPLACTLLFGTLLAERLRSVSGSACRASAAVCMEVSSAPRGWQPLPGTGQVVGWPGSLPSQRFRSPAALVLSPAAPPTCNGSVWIYQRIEPSSRAPTVCHNFANAHLHLLYANAFF